MSLKQGGYLDYLGGPNVITNFHKNEKGKQERKSK